MKLSPEATLWVLILASATTAVRAEYKETMDPNGPSKKNLKSDYGLVDDNAEADQSDVFQKAIDDLAKDGGGSLVVPKGIYRLAGVKLRSNIHLLIEKDTVLKPYWPKGTKTVVFLLDAERPSKKAKMTPEQEQAYIENVSIRGVGGQFTIDYSDRERAKGEGVRGVLAKMVKNFLIENMDVQDNFSVYCGITLTPTDATDITGWKVSRATDGTIRNCRIFNASPGYGLTQLHGAQSVYFENIYAKGGVTLRLETGAVGPQIGVFDITAKNVTCEDGRCAVMFGPHSAKNGLVKVDGVVAKSCAYAVTTGDGGVKDAQLKIEPDAENGSFAAGSYVKNIRVIFGMTAQFKTHDLLSVPEEYYADLKLRWENKFFEGPSIGGVKDSSGDQYHIDIENVTLEGFKYNADKPILKAEDARPGHWSDALKEWKASRGLPVEEKKKKKEKKSR